MPLKAAFLTVNAGALREDLNAEAPRRSEDAIVLCMGGGIDLRCCSEEKEGRNPSRGRNIPGQWKLKGRAQGKARLALNTQP